MFLRKTTRIVFYFLVLIFVILFCLFFFNFANRKILPGFKPFYNLKPYNFNVFNKTTKEPFNIFMIETNENSQSFNLKQLCSIESAAYHNPEATVYVQSIKAKINFPLLFERYKNIKWSLLDLREAFENTALESWWKQGKLTRHDPYYRYSHLSDALRLALIYKNGGVYSDLDHITIKNFQPIIRYSAIVNNDKHEVLPESSFFHITKGHRYLKMAINEFALNYQPKKWGANGPSLLNRCIRAYCPSSNIEDLLINSNIDQTSYNCDIGILPYFIAYPYAWDESYKLFQNDGKIEVERFLHSFTIHFNSKLTTGYDINLNSNSMFEFFMAHNCPLVYQNFYFLK